MTRRVGARALPILLLSAILGGGGCGLGPGAGVRPTPSASATPDVVLPDFNSRLGSNRLAAVAAAAMGRKLFSQGQFWEVYVRTQPATLSGTYDPGNQAAAAAMAAQVVSADVVMATESGAAIKAFGQGGDARERQELADLDAVLRQAFPHLTGDTMKIYYGEAFQHGTATFAAGRLVSYDVRKLG